MSERELRARVARELAVPAARLVDVDRALLEAIERRLAELREAAAVDEMTGALRRAAGLAALEREVRRAHRFGDRDLVVAFVDLDDLKGVNDTRGHAAGDAVLREAAAALRRRLRAYDLVIRWGGDEFVCSLPGAGLEAARRALDDICAEFSARTGCTFTAGFAALGAQAAAPGDALVDAGALVDSADADYYATMRRSGRAAAAGRRGRPVTVAPGGPRREGSAQPA